MSTNDKTNLALLQKIKRLREKVDYLNSQLKNKKFGLSWIDVPESFDAESENKIPILEEVPELAIYNDDGKPTHILIEGDNYHALTCLNYTHHGKVDVIYIDPPYNTGSDGFTYKDSRFLTEYPDGTTIHKNHPLRHSAWLSFMEKRLRLAKDLLKDSGVIFISIDENELTNLSSLCNSIWGVSNNVATLVWQKRKGGGNDSTHIAVDHEYILIYVNNKSNAKWRVGYSSEYLRRYRFEDDISRYYFDTLSRPGLNNPIIYDVECPDGSIIKNGMWQISEKAFLNGKRNGDVIFVKNDDGGYTPMHKVRMPEGRVFRSIISNVSNKDAADEMEMLFDNKKAFSNPKPTRLIEQLIEIPNLSKAPIILDFFAGSGTTLHATAKFVKNGNNAQCILVQLPEKTWELQNDEKVAKRGNEITFDLGYDNLAEVVYDRCKKVLNGYNSSKTNTEILYSENITLRKLNNGAELIRNVQQLKEDNLSLFNEIKIAFEDGVLSVKGKRIANTHIIGLGGSLKYYRTSFVGKNQPKDATDEDKLTLAKKANCLLSIAENTLYETESTDYYQLYTDNMGKCTAIYFQEDYSKFDEFRNKVIELGGKVNVYIFSWTNGSEFESEFEFEDNISVKSIPQPILDIYKSLNI